jgi:hypothetical protein
VSGSAEPPPLPWFWFVVDVLAAIAFAIAVLLWLITSSPGLLIRMITTMFCAFWFAFATAVAVCCVAALSAACAADAGSCESAGVADVP